MKMRFRVRGLFLFSILVALLLCIGFAVRPIDGFVGNVRLLFVEDTTNWADAYTDSGFRAVRVGMSRSEVYKLLGIPFSARLYPDGTIGESWAMIRHASSYRQREVIFDKDYRVVRTIAAVVINRTEYNLQ
jgi:hypothetical protein